MRNDKVVWHALEYEYREKTREWFYVLFIIATALLVVALLFKSFLFAILIMVGTGAIALHARKEPPLLEFEINRSGIVVNKTFYPYSFLHSFYLERSDPSRIKLLMVSKKTFMPLIVIPLGELDPDEVQNFLAHYLKEREQQEPLSHKLLEYFGF